MHIFLPYHAYHVLVICALILLKVLSQGNSNIWQIMATKNILIQITRHNPSQGYTALTAQINLRQAIVNGAESSPS